jgi:hypothetical protein
MRPIYNVSQRSAGSSPPDQPFQANAAASIPGTPIMYREIQEIATYCELIQDLSKNVVKYV